MLKTPILAHKVGGILEILKDEINGYFFNHDGALDLSKKNKNILKDDVLYENLQKGCYKIFESNFEMSTQNLDKRIDLILNNI